MRRTEEMIKAFRSQTSRELAYLFAEKKIRAGVQSGPNYRGVTILDRVKDFSKRLKEEGVEVREIGKVIRMPDTHGNPVDIQLPLGESLAEESRVKEVYFLYGEQRYSKGRISISSKTENSEGWAATPRDVYLNCSVEHISPVNEIEKNAEKIPRILDSFERAYSLEEKLQEKA